MLRLSLFVILFTQSVRTAFVTDAPNLYKQIYEKLERLNPTNREGGSQSSVNLYAKLERLNSATTEKVELTDEDEELLAAMQAWLNGEQMDGVMKDIHKYKVDKTDSEQEYSESDYADEDTYLVEADYPMDANDDWDDEPMDSGSTSKPVVIAVTPSAITKLETGKTESSAAAAIAATNARPKIIEDPDMSLLERRQLQSAVLINTRALVHAGKCLVPQARWLSVRQLAPAADTVYTPPCVQLHRCAPDSGCCINEEDVCAPVEGRHVIFPFYLHKADGTFNAVRMQFYNHTQCACVSRRTLKRRTKAGKNLRTRSFSDSQEDEIQAPSVRHSGMRLPTEEPALVRDEEETIAPPQLRRCTCPAFFLAKVNETTPCSCICDWPDNGRKRDCQSLARGLEHFGLRDRVCVARGDCTVPNCEYGPYDKSAGTCPSRRYRRMRYHLRSRL